MNNIATIEQPFELSLDTPSKAVMATNIINDMVEFTKSLVVDSDPAYKKITSMYRQAREWKKNIDARRKEMTEPLRKQTASINDKAKELTDPLDSVIEMANAKANGYLHLLEQAKKKEDEELRAAAALFGEGELYIPPMEKTVRGDGAVTVTKQVTKFRLVDISKVPSRYLVVDEAAVKKDLALGVAEIPGLEIYQETTTQLRVR